MQEILEQFTRTGLRERREKALLTQGDLAEKLGVSRITVNKWEVGKAVPSMKHLRALKRVFKEK